MLAPTSATLAPGNRFLTLADTRVQFTAPSQPLSALLAVPQQFDDLLRAIYKGPLESKPWETFLHLLRDCLGATHGVMIMRPAEPDRPSLMVIVGPMQTEVFDSYNEHFFKLDPFSNLPAHQVVTSSDVMSDEEWLNSVFYREYVKPSGLRHAMAVWLRPDPDCNGYSLRIVRPDGTACFSADDKKLIERLLPHLQQAVELRSRMQDLAIERQLFAGTIERMQVGTVMLDEKGSVLSLNAHAQAILGEQDGISLSGKTLKIEYAEEQQALKALIASALAITRGEPGTKAKRPAAVEAVAITRPSGRPKLSALVRPVPADEYAEGWNRPRVAVFLRDPGARAQGSSEVLRRLFDLTRAEARLALLLANGLTLEDAGDQLGIRRNTVRAHLRSIFSKMGVKRQTELIRLVSNSVVDLA